MTTIEKLVGITSQHNEIVKRVGNGSLDADAVRRALQDIIEGKALISIPGTPSWYTEPAYQVTHVADLLVENPQWGFTKADIPPIPQGIVLQGNEVLMLSIYLPKKGKVGGIQRTFDELWGAAKAPDGFTKYRWPELKSDAKHLRLVEGRTHQPGIRWVVIDLMTNWEPERGRKVETLWAQDNHAKLAASEVLMAAILFPDWVAATDGAKIPHADMAGYQFNWDDVKEAWARCPYLRRWADARQLRLDACWADRVHRSWSAPSFRDL